MMEMQRPVLRYFGGKFLLAPWIISHFPKHRVYVEPFGGAASVLMRKPRSYAEVYNDLDGDVVSLFRVLQNKETAAELERLLKLTPFARDEFNLAYEPVENPIERARRLIIRAESHVGADGHNSQKGKTGFRANSNRLGTTPAHDWANYAQVLPQFCERLEGVVIENRDALEVMAQQDGPEALHFCDPPYIHDTRGAKHGYVHEMTDEAHVRLVSFLKELKGMVIICGYEHPIYESLGWFQVKRSAHADGARDRIESLWINPAAEKAMPQAELFAGGAAN